jgi:hypothetical protein
VKRRVRPCFCLILLLALVAFLAFKASPSFAKALTPEENYDRILLKHPVPQITQATWKIMQPTLRYSWSPVATKVLITVENGAIKSVVTKQSTGLKAADDDVADWVRTKWRFRPGITGTFNFPVYINSNAVLLRGGETLERPLTLTKGQLGKDVAISTERLVIRTDIDQGRITKIGVLKSTGDRKLDAAAVRWVKENLIFSSKNGVFLTPVIFSRKE